MAQYADWIMLLTRTNPDTPRHQGITFMLVDMKTPGIEVRPIINMAGRHEFNEVLFNNARVPRGNVVGEENKGWYVAVTLLDFERSGIDYSATGRRLQSLRAAEAVSTARPASATVAVATVPTV